jgi:hypothetical protein
MDRSAATAVIWVFGIAFAALAFYALIDFLIKSNRP